MLKKKIRRRGDDDKMIKKPPKPEHDTKSYIWNIWITQFANKIYNSF